MAVNVERLQVYLWIFFSPNAVPSTVRSVTLKLLAVSRSIVTQAQVDGSFGESVQKEKIIFCILSVT